MCDKRGKGEEGSEKYTPWLSNGGGWSWHYSIDNPNISGNTKFNLMCLLVKDSDFDRYNEKIWIIGTPDGCPNLEKRDQ